MINKSLDSCTRCVFGKKQTEITRKERREPDRKTADDSLNRNKSNNWHKTCLPLFFYSLIPLSSPAADTVCKACLYSSRLARFSCPRRRRRNLLARDSCIIHPEKRIKHFYVHVCGQVFCLRRRSVFFIHSKRSEQQHQLR